VLVPIQRPRTIEETIITRSKEVVMSQLTIDPAIEGGTDDDFDLDIEFIEAGGTVEHIIQMTEDNCGGTCASACTSC
jgi:FxLD family lantipeptide